MANVLQQAVQATTLNYTDKDRAPKYQPMGGLTPDQIEANAPVDDVSQFARKLAGGVYSGANELVTATMTGIAAATDNKVLRDSAEMSRNETQGKIDVFTRENTQESGWMDTLSYGLGKYLGIPGLSAAGIGRLGVAATGAVLAGETGAISYQETKQELMKQGVDRDTSNTAGVITGVGMGLSTVIPVAPSLTSAVRATTKLSAGIAAGAFAGVGISQGSLGLAGTYVSDKGLRIQDPDLANKYKKAGEQYKEIATDPVSWGIGLGMGVLIGGAVGYSKYKQFKAEEALINHYKNNPLATQAEIDAVRQSNPTRYKNANEYTPADIELERKGREDPNWTPNQEALDFEIATIIDVTKRIEQAKDYSYNDIASAGILTTSDMNIILNNNRLIGLFNKTGDERYLDQLEIPQVHRDAYLLRYEDPDVGGYTGLVDSRANSDENIRERYFDIAGIHAAYNSNIPYIPPHTTNVTEQAKSNPAVKYKDNIGDTIGKGEGGWYSFNKGKPGDSPNQKLDENITIQDIQTRQALAKDDPNRLFAVGKYQIIPSTLKAAIKALGLKPDTKFTPEVQEYIFREYLMKKQPEVYEYIAGVSDNLESAVLGMAQEFASVGIPRDIAGKTKGSSYYSDNKASISPDTVARQLSQQRDRYQEAIKKGMSKEEAWAYSFGDSTIQAKLSSTVKGDIKRTQSTNKDGSIFKEGANVDVDVDRYFISGAPPRTEFIVPEKPFSIVGYIKDLFGANNTYRGELGRLAGKDLDQVSMQSRAIQKVYEELSYQYALNIRDKALKMTPSLTKTEVQTIMRNAWDNHQANLKIGQSKIFNEEYASNIARGDNEQEALSKALTATNIRLKAAAIGQSTRTGFSQNQSKQDDSNTVVQDITNTTGSVKDQTINGKKVVDEQDVTNNKPGRDPKDDDGNATKDGNAKDGNAKDGKANAKDGNDKDGKANDKDGNTKDGNDKDDGNATKDDGTKTSKLTLDDGSTLTRISAKLPDGRVRNVFIDTQGNRTLHDQPTKADPNAVANLVNSGLKDTDTVNINGQVLSKAEIQQLLALNGKIDNNALEAFATCALNFGNP
jgi:hypothetical protein